MPINDIQQLLRVDSGMCRENADIRRTLLKVSEFGGYLVKKGRCRPKFPSLEKGAKQEPREANQLAPLRDIRKRNKNRESLPEATPTTWHSLQLFGFLRLLSCLILLIARYKCFPTTGICSIQTKILLGYL